MYLGLVWFFFPLYFGNSNPTPGLELFFVKHSSDSGRLAIKRDKSSRG